MLVDSDAAPDAAPALVIGFDVWRSRFASDPGIVGHVIRLGETAYTVVGVMPDGFAFPVNHQYWIPLGSPGPTAQVFVAGRLAPGFNLDDANAELTAIGQRMAARLPDPHQHLQPEVLPYTYPFAGMSRSSSDAFWPVTVLISLILVVVCVNVAILIYARTATRLGEIAVRTALGASRSRIVAQLFAESFVLSVVAAGVGILIVKSALDWARSGVAQMAQSHFWPEYRLSVTAVIYGVTLAVLAAVITGVIPAIRATGRRAPFDLRDLRSGGRLRLGRTWTTLIVVQVSLASAALPIAVGLGWFQVRDIFNLPRFPVDQILFAEVELDRAPRAGQDARTYWSRLGADFAHRQDALSRRLDTEPGVVSHAFTTNLPNIGPSASIVIEHDPTGMTRQVQPAAVGIDFFRTFDVDVLAGRTLTAGDFGEQPAGVAVVDRAFVNRLLGGGDALARRIRLIPEGPWLEIVGVVENIDVNPFGDDLVKSRVYQPLKGDRGGARLAVRIAATDRGALARKLPAIAAALDPALHVRVGPLEDMYRLQRLALTTAALGIGVALLSVVLLSAAGIYALMSFTVTRRRREIAIRTALGAQPHRLLRGIFSQALRQISLGVAIGVAVALLIDYSQEGEALAGHGGVILPAMVIVMSGVGLLAALGPARRGLRIEPVESLKSE